MAEQWTIRKTADRIAKINTLAAHLHTTPDKITLIFDYLLMMAMVDMPRDPRPGSSPAGITRPAAPAPDQAKMDAIMADMARLKTNDTLTPEEKLILYITLNPKAEINECEQQHIINKLNKEM